MKMILSTAALIALVSAPALAGPAADSAKAHIAAVAKGDLAAAVSSYGPGSTLHWVGGPLDGTYAGADAIKGAWGKFAKAQGELKAEIASLAESANPKGATVTANVVFTGQNTIKVRYVLMYRDGKLVNEIWQVDPSLSN